LKKLLIIFCALMLVVTACGRADENLNEDDNNKPIENSIKDNNTGANANNNTFDAGEKTLVGKGQGYGGEITVAVTVNGEDIVSVEAVGKDETEGVGSKVTLLAFTEQFIGKDASGEISEGDYDAVSGATYSSKSFLSAVNNAINVYAEYVK